MKINLESWKPYQIKAFFDIHPTKAYKNMSKDELCDGGSTPLVDIVRCVQRNELE